MKLIEGLRAATRRTLCRGVLALLALGALLVTNATRGQGLSTTTVQGTVYLANGQVGSGTLTVRWPSFTTAVGQAVAAGNMTVQIGVDGFVCLNLSPNQGAVPAGLFYTAVFYLSDGTTSTEYWVVPATPTATLGQVRAQVMPAAQAVQAVSKTYVDQAIARITQNSLTASGGNLSGPLYLSGDPVQTLQAADKHYVDAQVASAVPLAGGSMTGALTLSGDPTQDLQAANKRYVDTAAGAATSIAMANISPVSVGIGANGQIAYYTGNGTAIGGVSAVPVAAGGTGASSAASALANLGGLPSTGGTLTGPLNGGNATFSGTITANSTFAGPGTGLTGIASNLTSGMATHAQNLPADFAIQSASSPAVGNFSQVNAHSVNGDINNVFSVTTYGAVGNCTGAGSVASCTDNTAAFQAAIDAAYPLKGVVSVPTSSNAGTNGQTVYYLANTVNLKGVSIVGPPSGAGQINIGMSQLPVAVRGAAGKDVFAFGDPADAGFVALDPDWHIRDLALIVDTTVDASASHPYRKPGKTCWDAAITTGTNVLTSPGNQCVFEPGDVGQAILVYGAGASGANLSTTITGCTQTYASKSNTCSSVTLAANASTTVSGATAYVSVMNLPVTATIGNCAFAADDRVSAATNIVTHPEFSNVSIMPAGSNGNSACGILFQGQTAPYQGRFINVNIGTIPFGYAFIPPNVGPVSGNQIPGITDFNVFEHSWNEALYPFLSYGGNANKISDWQLYSSLGYGPHILDGYYLGGGGNAGAWSIDIPEQEGVCQSNSIPLRIGGGGHQVNRLHVLHCATATTQWDAQQSVIKGLSMWNGTLNITGANNKFHSTGCCGYPDTINVTNIGNLLDNDMNANPFDGLVPETGYGRTSAGTGQFASSFGVPAVSRDKVAFNRTADFLGTGASNYYFNKEDLLLWPGEVGGWGNNPTVVTDATSESGVNGSVSGTSGLAILSVAGVYDYIGKQVPAGLVRVYFKVKGSSSFSETLYAGVNALGYGPNACSTTVTVTTSWQTFYCDADLSAYAGQTFNPKLSAPGTGNTIYFAWIGVRPWDAASIATNLQIGGAGTAMSANHGNGASVQHSDGTGTSTLAAFDSNGNTTAATGTQVATALGSTAVTNAMNAATVANSGGTTASGTDYLCYLASDTSIQEACNTGIFYVNPGGNTFGSNKASTIFNLSAGTSSSLGLGNADGMKAYVDIGSGTFRPASAGSMSLGTSAYPWSTVNANRWDHGSTTIIPTTVTAAAHGNSSGTSLQLSDGTGTSQAAFLDANGNLTGAAQLVTGTNTVSRTTTATATNSWASTGLVLPTVQVNTTKSGHCTILWQMSSTSYTATFGLGMNNAPTNVWGGTRVIYATAGTTNWLAFTQSSTSTTAISAATTAGATGTTYMALVDFVIQTGASNPVSMTMYGQTSNSGATLTIMPGSTCYWLP